MLFMSSFHDAVSFHCICVFGKFSVALIRPIRLLKALRWRPRARLSLGTCRNVHDGGPRRSRKLNFEKRSPWRNSSTTCFRRTMARCHAAGRRRECSTQFQWTVLCHFVGGKPEFNEGGLRSERYPTTFVDELFIHVYLVYLSVAMRHEATLYQACRQTQKVEKRDP